MISVSMFYDDLIMIGAKVATVLLLAATIASSLKDFGLNKPHLLFHLG